VASAGSPGNRASRPATDAAGAGSQRRRPASLECAWCGTGITVKTRGRTPKWCSNTCRHRAWEQTRAAQSGRAAVEIVERVVTVETTVKVADNRLPRGQEWADQLRSLTRQLDDGRLYDRDLTAVARASVELNQALQRRLTRRDRPRRYY
jgi:hypothetical protein